MDQDVAFTIWVDGAKAMVEVLARHESVNFEIGGRFSNPKGHALASIEASGRVLVTFTQKSPPATEAKYETRRYKCTRDGSRKAGEDIAHFLMSGEFVVD